MFENTEEIINFTLNIIAILFDIIGCFTSIVVFICIIRYQISNRLKSQEKIILILSIDIYFYIIFSIIVQLILAIHSLLGDLYPRNFNSQWCIINGYFIVVLLSGLYYSFVLQAIYRLCRIVYTKYRYLQMYGFYMILMPGQLLFACIIMCPLFIWNDIIYLENEYYCFVLYTNIRCVVWLATTIQNIPILLLIIIYIRIIIFIRRHRNTQSVLIKRKQKRDLLAIRRVIITVQILLLFAIPIMAMMLIAIINGVEHFLTHRLTMLSYAMCTAMLSIQTVFVTPQLKTLVYKIFQSNRIEPIANVVVASIQMRNSCHTK